MTPEELFLKYMDRLYRMALFMLFSVQDAEDIVQETYIRLLVKQPKFHDEEHAKAWLIRVCINLCKNQLRFRKRHLQDNIEGLQKPIVRTEVYEIMHSVHFLPEKLRKVMILHAVEGYSVKEISKILKISESAVKKRLQRGRDLLRKEVLS